MSAPLHRPVDEFGSFNMSDFICTGRAAVEAYAANVRSGAFPVQRRSGHERKYPPA
jgi:ketopantoate hydroxymethyltransferase